MEQEGGNLSDHREEGKSASDEECDGHTELGPDDVGKVCLLPRMRVLLWCNLGLYTITM